MTDIILRQKLRQLKKEFHKKENQLKKIKRLKKAKNHVKKIVQIQKSQNYTNDSTSQVVTSKSSKIVTFSSCKNSNLENLCINEANNFDKPNNVNSNDNLTIQDCQSSRNIKTQNSLHLSSNTVNICTAADDTNKSHFSKDSTNLQKRSSSRIKGQIIDKEAIDKCVKEINAELNNSEKENKKSQEITTKKTFEFPKFPSNCRNKSTYFYLPSEDFPSIDTAFTQSAIFPEVPYQLKDLECKDFSVTDLIKLEVVETEIFKNKACHYSKKNCNVTLEEKSKPDEIISECNFSTDQINETKEIFEDGNNSYQKNLSEANESNISLNGISYECKQVNVNSNVLAAEKTKLEVKLDCSNSFLNSTQDTTVTNHASCSGYTLTDCLKISENSIIDLSMQSSTDETILLVCTANQLSLFHILHENFIITLVSSWQSKNERNMEILKTDCGFYTTSYKDINVNSLVVRFHSVDFKSGIKWNQWAMDISINAGDPDSQSGSNAREVKFYTLLPCSYPTFLYMRCGIKTVLFKCDISLQERKIIGSLEHPQSSVCNVTDLPDAIMTSNLESLCIWNHESCELVCRLLIPSHLEILGVHWAVNQKGLLFLGHLSKNSNVGIAVLNPSTGDFISLIQVCSDPSPVLRFFPDYFNNSLITVVSSNSFRIWNIQTGEAVCQMSLSSHSPRVTCCLSTNSFLIFGLNNGFIHTYKFKLP